MIRSLRSIRELSCDSCVWIPGRRGPAEPFSVKCFGDDPETWAAISRWAASRYAWDCGPFSRNNPPRCDEAVQLFLYRLATIPAETWQRLGVGYGDRIRALWAVRAWCRRSGWNESRGKGRRKGSKYRSYVASMSAQPHNPATVAMAAEAAERGITGRSAGRGRPRIETVQVSRRDALAMIGGEPQREIVVGPIHVSGGVATVDTDGQMREIVIREIVTPETVETETAWKMVSGRTKIEYPPCFVAEAVDAGTERNRYVPAPVPTPRPSGAVNHATPVYAANREAYLSSVAARRREDEAAGWKDWRAEAEAGRVAWAEMVHRWSERD